MRDRAATLHGTLTVSRRPEGGTRVELAFAPRGPFTSPGLGVSEQAAAA
jgi:nitrate/nitrite-specific signal transduction histidine kinase